MTAIKYCPNVRFYLDLLRGARPLRQLITLASHKNLQKAANINPKEIESVLFRLEQLHNVAIAPEGIVVPESASFRHNRTELRLLAKQGLGHLVELMGENGVLDIRSIGLAAKLEGKHETSVRRVLDILRDGRPLGELITPESEKRLRDLIIIPELRQEVRAFLKALLTLHYRGTRFLQIVIPGDLGELQNRSVLRSLGSVEFLSGLIKDNVLDLRKAGLKVKIPYIDQTPRITKPTFDAELERIVQLKEKIAHNYRTTTGELGDLIFFELLLAAELELYVLGEQKSAAKRQKKANPELYRAKCDEMRGFSDKLALILKSFPFPEKPPAVDKEGLSEWQKKRVERIEQRYGFRDSLETARAETAKLNNPTADNALATAMKKLITMLKEHEKERVDRYIERVKSSSPEGKFRIVDDLCGIFGARRFSYVKDESGTYVRVVKEYIYGHPQEFIDSFDEILASEQKEKADNKGIIANLEKVGRSALEYFPELFELSLGAHKLSFDLAVDETSDDNYQLLRDIYKRKAQLELGGAVRLCNVANGQAHELAADLAGMAAEDYRQRNRIVQAQMDHLPIEKAYGEKLVGELIGKLVDRWAKYFAGEPKLHPETMEKIKKRIRVYFGTVFGAKDEEYKINWIRQARSHIQAIIKMMDRVLPLVAEQRKLSRRLFHPSAPWNRSPERRTAADLLKKRGIEKQLRDTEDELDSLRFASLPIKLCREILKIEFDFQNRGVAFKSGDKKMALERFMNEQAKKYNSKIAFPKIY